MGLYAFPHLRNDSTAGDHKGPPYTSLPPSPLRTIRRFFVQSTLLRAIPAGRPARVTLYKPYILYEQLHLFVFTFDGVVVRGTLIG